MRQFLFFSHSLTSSFLFLILHTLILSLSISLYFKFYYLYFTLFLLSIYFSFSTSLFMSLCHRLCFNFLSVFPNDNFLSLFVCLHPWKTPNPKYKTFLCHQKVFWTEKVFHIVSYNKVFFSMCCPNWSKVCTHILGYIPCPVGIFICYSSAHFLEWQFCHPVMYLSITDLEVGTVWWYINWGWPSFGLKQFLMVQL